MDHTPTEEELIEAWAHQACMDPFCSGGCPERFPAMEAIRKIKAQAWQEGHGDPHCDEWVVGTMCAEYHPNPYKEEA